MEKAKAKRKAEIEETITFGLLVLVGVTLIALVAWGTVEYVTFMGK
jgi:hypothetical protein